MARIPAEEVERLKHEVSLRRLAEQAGCDLKRHGSQLKCRCPFGQHKDDEASLVISEEKNVFNCFGCGAGGSPIDWVMRAYGVNFRHAIELLQADLPPPPATALGAKASRVRHLPSPVAFDADDRALLEQVVGYYHERLQQSSTALAYLDKRGLTSPEAIATFRLGFADRSLGLRLPSKRTKEGEAIRCRLEKLGLYRSSGHEHFNGSLVIPVFAEDGSVAEMYGRKITTGLRKGTPLHLYLPGPHRGVFNVEALPATSEVILCESLLDALTLWCHGYRNVTASYGVHGFTSEHLEAFQRHGIERVLIAYDRDESGDGAAKTLAEKLCTEGIDAYRVELPRGMDVNEYALKVTPAQKSLGVVLRKASWMGNGRPPNRPSLAVPAPPSAPPSSSSDRSLIPLAAKEEDPGSLAAKEGTDENSSAEEIAPADEPASSEAGAETASAAAEVDVPAEEPPSEATAAAEPLASPVPKAPAEPPPYVVREGEAEVVLAERRYRVRGLPRTPSCDRLNVLVLLDRTDEADRGTFADRLDLFVARQREAYARQAEAELDLEAGVVRADLATLLNRLEEVQQELVRRAIEAEKPMPAKLSDEERTKALELLTDPALFDRILADFERCGVVGERTNKLVGYLAAVSRKLSEPLGVIIQSSSAAGKSSLMEAILAFVPREDREKFSAVTGQSLFYAEDLVLEHKVLAIVEEEGAERATYALKLLQSEGELTIASTGKDGESGRLTTRIYHVEGPVMILLTTTAFEIDEELQNRCIVLTVDEDREQTRAIHRLQRQRLTLDGQQRHRERDQVLELHRNAQRLLRPLQVVVPWADKLTFLDDRTRTRRDHTKYLTLIETVALLHQFQRPVRRAPAGDFDYIEATLEDIALANRLASEVLGRSLDELAPQTRRLLLQLNELVNERAKATKRARVSIRFSRREARAYTGWGQEQLRIHLGRLVDFEYLVVHRGGRGLGYVYELLYDGEGQDGSPFLVGLLDVESLREAGDEANLPGPESQLPALEAD